MQLTSKVSFFWKGDQFTKAVKAEMANRLEKSCEHLKTHVQQNLSEGSGTDQAPSQPGEFPNDAKHELAKRVFAKVYRRELRGEVGVPAGHWGNIAFWLEFGTSGPVEIRPVNAKALTIPITAARAQEIMSNPKLFKTGKSGRVIKAGNSHRQLMRRAGIITIKGQLYLLRSFAKRGPMLQRSFLRRTLEEERPAIRAIMMAPLPKGMSGGLTETAQSVTVAAPSDQGTT
jgi:hypothetical protein